MTITSPVHFVFLKFILFSIQCFLQNQPGTSLEKQIRQWTAPLPYH
ncbi:hypothetical protein J9317_16960 [Metabacillus sp. KIGAM252]|uniref:Uncharacterized protein n=1 Tax=Metabacillus flavus TaxID=2823519 RepID=A0ABS5LI70_9BACI|nr:hypothetical protein [Metabacillus flavus]MBS2970440.1 hypothetical protein [Metabacillus flavus]